MMCGFDFALWPDETRSCFFFFFFFFVIFFFFFFFCITSFSFFQSNGILTTSVKQSPNMVMLDLV